jgi:GNAT superfamily N-acetyltransferase
MTSVSIDDATAVDSQRLDRFLRGCFSGRKRDFLRDHGTWRHRGDQNRLVALIGGEVAGYCAVIPTQVFLRDRAVPGLWWVDLYVDPPYRGRGIARRFDEAVSAMKGVKLGIPNRVAARIHRQHGWGVRDDYRLLMVPLAPLSVPRVREAVGARGLALRAGARLLGPAARLYRRRLARYEPTSARVVESPDPDALAAVFRRHRRGWVTTDRTARFIRWRYLDSPHRSQYTFFVGGPSPPSLAAVLRTFLHRGAKVTRVLDVFGDLSDGEGLRDLLKLVTREAAGVGASQVSAKATHPALASALRSVGFVFGVRSSFCWLSDDADVMRTIEEGPCHWMLADSDSDTPD